MLGCQSWCWKGWGPRPSVGDPQDMDEERWRWIGGDSEDPCGRCVFHQNKGRRDRFERPLRKRYLQEGGRSGPSEFYGAGVHLRVISIYILKCSFMTWKMKEADEETGQAGMCSSPTGSQAGCTEWEGRHPEAAAVHQARSWRRSLDAARCLCRPLGCQRDFTADMTRFRTSSHHWWDWLWCTARLNLAGLEAAPLKPGSYSEIYMKLQSKPLDAAGNSQ